MNDAIAANEDVLDYASDYCGGVKTAITNKLAFLKELIDLDPTQ